MRFALSILLLISFSSSFAQKGKRSNYDLLWRISGNGLTKPSYLFGTMHLQDDRAFNFNDSVLTKIIQCDAFAMEIHPDSVTRTVAQLLIEETDDNSTIESKMSQREFQYYDSLMKKNSGLSLSKFKTLKQANYFMEHRSVKKDKATFLDAWLYNVARENKKTILGLEDFRTQLKLFQRHDSTELQQLKNYLSSNEGNKNQSLQTLFDLYYDGSVDNIYEFAKAGSSPRHFQEMIIDRNIDMTANIIVEIHRRSVFIAVGAAHLGWTPGIVTLLRQKGYTLTPVKAPFNNTASKYKTVAPEPDENWFVFNSQDGRYTVEMPQAPMPVKTKEMPITFQTYVDIGTMSVYMAGHLPALGAVNSQSASKFLDEMIKNMSAKQKVNSAKKILVNGNEGREVETSIGDNFFKARLIVNHSTVYLLMVGPSREAANSGGAKRFLSSFKVTSAPLPSSKSTFVDKEGAFSVDMPGTVTTQVMTPVEPTSQRQLKLNLFVSADNTTGANFLIRYNDFPAGYVSPNDSVYIQSTLQAVYTAMKGTDLATDSIDFNGYPATHFTFSIGNEQAKTEGILTLRGERFYMMMNTRAVDASAQIADSFFKSFRFLPYQSASLKHVTFPGFSLKLPENFAADSSITLNSELNVYALRENYSGNAFIIQDEPLSKYEEAGDADEFFKRISDKFEEEGVLQESNTIKGKFPAKQFLFKMKESNASFMMRSIVAGKSVYSLWGYFAPDSRSSVDEIFESFTATNSTSDWSLFSDKSDVLLNDIVSPDSVVRAEASGALYTYSFKVNHLPKIYRALKTPIDRSFESDVKNQLLGVLASVNDEGTMKFIEEIYPTLPDSTRLRDRAINVLASMKTEESVQRMTDLIANDNSGHKFSGYSFMYPILDSISLLKTVSVRLLKSYSKFERNSQLLSGIAAALDSNVYTQPMRLEIISLLTDIAANASQVQMNENSEGYHDMISEKYNVAVALSSIPFTPQIRDIIKSLSGENDDDIKFECLKLFLKNNVKVPQADIDRLAAKPMIRLQLYEELQKYKKQQLMDKKYTSHQMLAESEMYEYLWYEDEAPDRVKFLKEKKVVVKGEKKKIFVYTYGWEGGDESYIAMAGPYPLKAKEFSRGDLTSSLYDTYHDGKELAKQLRKHLSENEVTLTD